MTQMLDEREVSDLEDEFTMLGELGRGGSAVVYRARERARHTEVAVKVVHPRFAATADEEIARLRREARTVVRLQHPHIVTVHSVKCLADGGLALVMQLVRGRTLKQAVVEEGAFAPERAERVLRDIASALAFAHANGVIHRDVKPENIFLEMGTRQALLSDFGIAHSAEFDSRLTMTGTAIGTPAYMAPEQIDGQAASARSDLYSLGLAAWEMLTGRRPWEGDALYNVLHKQKHETLPSIESLRPREVPARLQYIVEKLLQKDPAARWQSADALMAALTDWSEPSDWVEWLASHYERARATAQPAPLQLVSDADPGTDHETPTMRFQRPEGGWWATETATSVTTTGEQPIITQRILDEAVAMTDEAPAPTLRLARSVYDEAEAAEPEEIDWVDVVKPPAARMLWQGVAAVVVVLAAGGAFVLYAQALAH